MKILLLKSWWFNIGDGFVKEGAKHLLCSAFPDATIIEASAMGANKYAVNSAYSDASDFPSIIDYISDDLDLVVMAGCVLNEKLDKLFKKLSPKERKFKLLFLGAGARNYSKKAVNKVVSHLNYLEPDYLIARDKRAFGCFGACFKKAELGIDCGYFVSDAHPFERQLSGLKIATFNRSFEPDFVKVSNFVSMNHIPLRLHGESSVRAFIRSGLSIFRKDPLKGTEKLVSDSLEEYLYFYANASEVHTDMVHSTVASISYQTPVKFYGSNHRTGVIYDLFGDEIYRDLYIDNRNILNTKKSLMRGLLKSVVDDA